MATQAQIIANRRNAQRSTGPRTPSGKTLASQNSLKHGLLARRNVITTESQEEFDHHRDALLNELDAQTPMESMLADRIVSLSWRLKRADLTQNQAIDTLIEETTTNPLAKLAKSFGIKGFAAPQPEPTDSHPDLTLGRIALKDFSNARVLDRLLMYERRIEHSLYKTTLEPSEPNLEPADRYLTPGPVPGGSTEPNNTPEPRQNHPTSTIQHPVSRSEAETPWGEHQKSSIIAQNKPNVKMGNINISPATTKPYLNEQRTINNERYPKQTQSNPIKDSSRSRDPAGIPSFA